MRWPKKLLIFLVLVISFNFISSSSIKAGCSTNCGWTSTACPGGDCTGFDDNNAGCRMASGICYCLEVIGCTAGIPACWPSSCSALSNLGIPSPMGCCSPPVTPIPTQVPGCGSCGGCTAACDSTCQGVCSGNGAPCTLSGVSCGGSSNHCSGGNCSPGCNPGVGDICGCGACPGQPGPHYDHPAAFVFDSQTGKGIPGVKFYLFYGDGPGVGNNPYGIPRMCQIVSDDNGEALAYGDNGTQDGCLFDTLQGYDIKPADTYNPDGSLKSPGSITAPAGYLPPLKTSSPGINYIWQPPWMHQPLNGLAYIGVPNRQDYHQGCGSTPQDGCDFILDPKPVGTIQGRIVLNGFSSNTPGSVKTDMIASCIGCTYSGQSQCVNTPSVNKLVAIFDGTNYNAALNTSCNGGGPYYSKIVQAEISQNVSIPVSPGEQVTWNCGATDSSGNNYPSGCPGASGIGSAVLVKVAQNGFTNVWFTISAPVCAVSGPTTTSAGLPSLPYTVVANRIAGVNSVGIYGKSPGLQNWNQYAYSALPLPNGTPNSPIFTGPGTTGNGPAIFQNGGNYDVVCNAYNTDPNSGAKCTGNPVVPSSGWTACGPLSEMTVSVPTCSFNIQPPDLLINKTTCQNNIPFQAQAQNGGIISSYDITISNSGGSGVTVTSPYNVPVSQQNINNSPTGTTNVCAPLLSATAPAASYLVTANLQSGGSCLSNKGSITLQDPTTKWWQLGGGGSAIAGGDLKSSVPSTTDFVCLPTSQNVCGIGVGGTSIDSNTDTQWAPNFATGKWLVAGSSRDTAIDSSFLSSSTVQVDALGNPIIVSTGKYSYSSMLTRAKSLVSPVDDPGLNQILSPFYISSHIAGYFTSDQVTYVHLTAPSVNITAVPVTGIGTGKLVIFADGTVNIKSDIVNHSGSTYGELVILSQKDINIDGLVANLDGVYFTDGSFNTGDDGLGRKLSVNGTIVASLVINLQRTPAQRTSLETFNYIPSYIINFPQGLLRRHVIQNLTAP